MTSAASELRDMTDEDLNQKLREAKSELFNLRFQSATGQLANNASLRSVRRSIARIYTVQREREIGIEAGTQEELESQVETSANE